MAVLSPNPLLVPCIFENIHGFCHCLFNICQSKMEVAICLNVVSELKIGSGKVSCGSEDVSSEKGSVRCQLWKVTSNKVQHLTIDIGSNGRQS